MKVYKYPGRNEWQQIVKRPVFDNYSLREKVRGILDEVKNEGDEALRKYTLQFDNAVLKELAVSSEEIKQAESLVNGKLKEAIRQAAENIRKFHEPQLLEEPVIETMPGIQCWRKNIAIEKVGLYIPGGSAPLFSTVLMLGIPAKIAGCREIILCSPPDADGRMNPVILFAAQLVGISAIYKLGGVQAIGAMAYGTETIPKVYKVFGPGNQYVTCAKQFVQQDGIAIDMPAGPSEVCVLADRSSKASFIASDLLSQAEHGVDSQVMFISDSEVLIKECLEEIDEQLKVLPRKEIVAKALENSTTVLVNNIEEGIDLVNEYAPEHLIISCRDDNRVAARVVNAGSIFLGNYSPESAGDYASGTNHTLPTNSFAKGYAGVSVDSFIRKITFQRLSKQGLEQIAETVVTMAEAEGLHGHANAVRLRTKMNDQ